MKNVQVIDCGDNCTFNTFQKTEEEFAQVLLAAGLDIGLHGALFNEFDRKRKRYPASKRERDWDHSSINHAQHKLYAG